MEARPVQELRQEVRPESELHPAVKQEMANTICKGALNVSLAGLIVTAIIYGVLAFYIFKVSSEDVSSNGNSCRSATFIKVWGVIVSLHLLFTLYLLWCRFRAYRLEKSAKSQ